MRGAGQDGCTHRGEWLAERGLSGWTRRAFAGVSLPQLRICVCACAAQRLKRVFDSCVQAQVEGGKQLLKEIITENTDTRKAIDERDKAEKVTMSNTSRGKEGLRIDHALVTRTEGHARKRVDG